MIKQGFDYTFGWIFLSADVRFIILIGGVSTTKRLEVVPGSSRICTVNNRNTREQVA
jgi:hypothetical protein